LDPEVRKKAKLNAQKQAEKDLAAEAKADLKAQKLHQKELKAAMEAAIKKRKPNKNFTPREVNILMISARKI
jgi:membrane protein involved in colicin uptake